MKNGVILFVVLANGLLIILISIFGNGLIFYELKVFQGFFGVKYDNVEYLKIVQKEFYHK